MYSLKTYLPFVLLVLALQAASVFAQEEPAAEPIPSPFPSLPPDPDEDQLEPLPPLEDELWWHGGSYLYAPEGDRLNYSITITDPIMLNEPFTLEWTRQWVPEIEMEPYDCVVDWQD